MAADTEKTNAREHLPSPIETEAELVLQLAELHCTNIEIAAIVGIHVNTLTRNHGEILDKGRSITKRKLRKAQIEAALEGNVAMLIWLGKQMLGQTDKLETANVNQEIKIDFVTNAEDPEADGAEPA